MAFEATTAHAALTKITCPRCGNHMRLSTIEPDGLGRDRMMFRCVCTFEYRQSFAAAEERLMQFKVAISKQGL